MMLHIHKSIDFGAMKTGMQQKRKKRIHKEALVFSVSGRYYRTILFNNDNGWTGNKKVRYHETLEFFI